MSINQTKINDFVRLATGEPIDAYSDAGAQRKRMFHTLGKSVARMLAAELDLPAGSYDIRSNLGGIAVCGEVTLHGEWIYVQLSQTPTGGHRFMYRSCRGRKDYTGGPNCWLDFQQLLDLSAAAKIMQQRVRALTSVA